VLFLDEILVLQPAEKISSTIHNGYNIAWPLAKGRCKFDWPLAKGGSPISFVGANI
jgi:hypothetical protein